MITETTQKVPPPGTETVTQVAAQEPQVQVQVQVQLSLAEMARRIAVLQAVKQHHESIAEMVSSQIARMKPLLHGMFADEGISEVRVAAKGPDGTLQFDDGQDRIVKPEIDIKAYCKVEQRPAFFAWMRANGFGALIKEEIHHSALSKWVDERIENKQPLPPKELLSVTELDSVKVTKSPKRK